MTKNKQYYIWIDWMKIIGLYFIILGHFFPPYSSYIYAFNVPLFFIISGFLTKKENDIKVFNKKCIDNLIIPVVILLLINYTWDICIHYDNLTLINFIKRITNAAMGMHGIHKGGGLGTCWFVYTLLVLKIIHQLFSLKIQKILLIALPVTAMILHHYELSLGNAVVNTTIAYPFWYIGLVLKQRQEYLQNISHIELKENIALLISAVLLYVTGRYNHTPWMYINEYGSSMFLFITGALAGTFIIYYISKRIDKYTKDKKYIRLLSSGSIIILGLHFILIDCLHLCNATGQGLKPIAYSLIIILMFIPINVFFKKYFPIIFGKRL